MRTAPLAGSIEPGGTLALSLPRGVRFDERGGLITLLNDKELKVDGVSYTAAQVERKGWSIIF
jgi:hypothetical protein